MNRRAELAMEKRTDVSMFMVHLTRDDRNVRTEEAGGNSAKGNFVNILETKRIVALDAKLDLARNIVSTSLKRLRSYTVDASGQRPCTVAQDWLTETFFRRPNL